MIKDYVAKAMRRAKIVIMDVSGRRVSGQVCVTRVIRPHIWAFITPPVCVRGKRQREHVPHQAPLLLGRADICKLRGWRCLKALITPALRAVAPSHRRLVLLMLSRVKHGGAVHNPLCC